MRYAAANAPYPYLPTVPQRVWKMIVVLEPNQGIEDVNQNTPVIVFDAPNAMPPAGTTTKFGKWYELPGSIISVEELEKRLNKDAIDRNLGIHYNFFNQPEIDDDVRNKLKQKVFTFPADKEPIEAFLLADSNFTTSADESTSTIIIPDTSIRHDSVAINGTRVIDRSSIQISTKQIGISEISAIQIGATEISTAQVGTTQVGFFQTRHEQVGATQIGTAQVDPIQSSLTDVGITQVSPNQVNVNQIGIAQFSSAQVDSSQVSTFQINTTQISPTKIPLPSSIPFDQLLSAYSGHNSPFASIYTINNSAQTLWTSLLNPTNPLNINLQIKDLPTGQLAEAVVTKFDPQGRPNGGTIIIDTDANGIGWYIDPTPFDHSEFTQPLTDTTFRATTTSPAAGKYDLLTTILHEMGHIAGIISGHNSFDRHIQTINNSPTFIGNNFTATLTPDGSHLDSKYHPHDLMNNTLTPGVRKLPSELNLLLLNTIRSGAAGTGNNYLQAPLTSAPLIGILNGTFDTNENWTTRGAATIINQQAVLTEDSLLNSKFSQSFTIPQDTKYLQFTLRNITLGNSTTTAPGDAFEVALLNAFTKSSLTDTIDLTHTDAFLNIQHDGTIYFGDNLTQINPYTYRLDIRNIQPNTTATLYFDLLGFGAKDARIVIDDVKLFSNEPIPPTANNDTATTNQTLPVTINILANDTDSDSELNLASVNITATPINGTVQINPDGTIIYTPNSNFVGTDTFTYTVLDIDGLPSNPATVTINVRNLAPELTSITTPNNILEGDIAQFNATATDTDTLTYTWNFGDGSNLIAGQNVNHTYLNNGTYEATLTVTDTWGASTTQTFTTTVNNVAPIVDAGEDRTIEEGTAIAAIL